jgi:hypothetical protein
MRPWLWSSWSTVLMWPIKRLPLNQWFDFSFNFSFLSIKAD